MERPNGVLTNSSSSLPRIQHEAMQSVMASKQPDRRITEKFVVKSPLGLEALQHCHHIVLYYNKASEHDSGWIAAGRIKESLGRALSEAPLLCGRLKSEEDCFKLVANDSGVRLVEARLPVILQEFLQLRKQEDHVEAQLVHWEDIDEKNPQFCPLFYVQVTNFQCGGYSIGISCNLVLADPLGLTNFIKKWIKIHTSMFSEGDSASVPVFYSPNLKTANSHAKPFYGSSSQDHHGQTLTFNVTSEKAMTGNTLELKSLILQCVERTEMKFGAKMNPNFTLFVKLLVFETKVEVCSKQEPGDAPVNSGMTISSSSWEDLKIKEIEFVQGNQALDASYWIGLRHGDGGLVVVDASSDKDASGAMHIFVTIPVEKKM